MPFSVDLHRKIDTVEPSLREVLWAMLNEIEQQRATAVTKEDFSELKGIVASIASIHERTDQKLETLTKNVNKLELAQTRTEESIKEFEQIQKRTDQKLETLTDNVNKLESAQTRTEEKIQTLTENVNKLEFAQSRTEESIKELEQVQKRTEENIGKLEQAQKRTENNIDKLVQAQAATNKRIDNLQGEMQQGFAHLNRQNEATRNQVEVTNEKLEVTHKKVEATNEKLEVTHNKVEATHNQLEKTHKQVESLRNQVGGLGRSMAYALENEAYRKLPAFLAQHHGVTIQKRLIRTMIGDREINVFAHGEQDGREVLVVGESVLRLDDGSKFEQLDKHLIVVQNAYHLPIIPIMITHFAPQRMQEKAKSAGIIVVQSFEWDKGESVHNG